jgi:hypothetical protein
MEWLATAMAVLQGTTCSQTIPAPPALQSPLTVLSVILRTQFRPAQLAQRKLEQSNLLNILI